VKSGYGNRIKEIRDRNGLSRDAFGKRLNLTYDQVRKIESEDRKPSDDIKVRICEEFKVSTDYILMGTEFVMPRTPSGLNMNMQTIMAKEAIHHLGQCVQSIKNLDGMAYGGLQRLKEMEAKVKKLEMDSEMEAALKLVRVDEMVANQ